MKSDSIGIFVSCSNVTLYVAKRPGAEVRDRLLVFAQAVIIKTEQFYRSKREALTYTVGRNGSS